MVDPWFYSFSRYRLLSISQPGAISLCHVLIYMGASLLRAGMDYCGGVQVRCMFEVVFFRECVNGNCGGTKDGNRGKYEYRVGGEFFLWVTFFFA